METPRFVRLNTPLVRHLPSESWRHARRRAWRKRAAAHGDFWLVHRQTSPALHAVCRSSQARAWRCTVTVTSTEPERNSPAPWIRCGHQLKSSQEIRSL